MPRFAGFPLLLAATILAGGCQSGVVSTSLSMRRGDEARVRVLGSRPYVELRNAGPGPVWVDFRAADAADGQEFVAGQSVGRGTSRGPIELRLRADTNADATVELRAQRMTGFQIDGPSPRPQPTW